MKSKWNFKIYPIFEKFIYIFYFLFTILIIYSIVTIGPDFINRKEIYIQANRNQLFSNGIFFILIILLFLLIYFLYKKFKNKKNKKSVKDLNTCSKKFVVNLITIAILFLVIQYIIVYFAGMITTWDVGYHQYLKKIK